MTCSGKVLLFDLETNLRELSALFRTSACVALAEVSGSMLENGAEVVD